VGSGVDVVRVFLGGRGFVWTVGVPMFLCLGWGYRVFCSLCWLAGGVGVFGPVLR